MYDFEERIMAKITDMETKSEEKHRAIVEDYEA
jgi:hypothetical protein